MNFLIKIPLLALVCLFLSLTNSNASWIYNEKESAFDGGSIIMAITASGGYALGLRCSKGKREAIFISTEKEFEPNVLKIANATRPIMLFRVDDTGIIELDGEVVGLNGKMGMITEVSPELFTQVRGAKRRIAVALKLLDQTYHETSFAARGSTKAVGKLSDNCQIQP